MDDLNEELQGWREATRPLISALAAIVEKRKAAVAALVKMGHENQSIADYPEIAKIIGLNVNYPVDPTNYLTDTDDLWLNYVNKVATAAGIQAILPKIQECLEAIKNLRMLEDAFRGCCQYTKTQAWEYLDGIQNYLDAERDNDNLMRRAGYIP